MLLAPLSAVDDYLFLDADYPGLEEGILVALMKHHSYIRFGS